MGAQRLTASHIESPGRPRPGRGCVRGAQRLTASHIESHGLPADFLNELEMCSTPYGISYRITSTAAGTPRHYDCAQRLTASHIESLFQAHGL